MILGSLLHQQLSEKHENVSPQLGHTFIRSTGLFSISHFAISRKYSTNPLFQVLMNKKSAVLSTFVF
jgi:hypothetical protein